MGGQCPNLPQSNICCNQTCRQLGGAGGLVVRPDLGDSGEAWCLHADNALCRTAMPQDCVMKSGPSTSGPSTSGPGTSGPTSGPGTSGPSTSGPGSA